MVWPFSKDKPETDSSENGIRKEEIKDEQQLSNYSRGQKFLLEDTKPRFPNESSGGLAREKERATLKEAWSTMSWEDFSVAKVVSIPCLREAGLTGFTSMFVVGSVMFLYHKNPSRAANWSVGGLMLGSIVGWEQCRMRRRRSFQIAELAKQTVAAKEKPMMHTIKNNDAVKKEWETTDTKKAWYKFW